MNYIHISTVYDTRKSQRQRWQQCTMMTLYKCTMMSSVTMKLCPRENKKNMSAGREYLYDPKASDQQTNQQLQQRKSRCNSWFCHTVCDDFR